MMPLRLNDAPLPAPARREVPLLVVADDDDDILTMVTLRLQRSGYDVVAARDGEEALETIARLRPDVAVLDVAMPKLTGLEVLERLRADASLASTAVVLLTARVTTGDVDRGMSAGADVYVTKPFSPQDLASRVEALLAS